MKILSLIWKDTLLRFADRSELLFFLVLPLVFTYFLSGGASGSASTSVALLVVDEDQSALSSALVDELEETATINVHRVSHLDAEKQFAEKRALAWLNIPAGFQAALLEGRDMRLELEKAANNNDAEVAGRAVVAAASTVRTRAALAMALSTLNGSASSDRQTAFTSSLDSLASSQGTTRRVETTRPAMLAQAAYDPAAQASIGQLVTWVLIPLIGTSGLFALERSQKTLQRLVTTPTRKATFLLGTITGQLIAALVQMLLLVLFGALVLKVRWGSSPSGLALILFTFGLASVALGTMLGTFMKTEKQASNLSIMLGMILALLGGAWWPLELFPDFLRKLVLANPTTWAVNGMSDLVLRGAGLPQMLPYAAALAGFALLFFTIGVLRFRYE